MAGYRSRQARSRAAFIAVGGHAPTPTPTPTVTISAAQSKAEGNSGAIVYTYTVTRSSSVGATSVPWSFQAGGTDASDYTGGTLPAGGAVALADGVTSGTITISVNGDAGVEGDETFTILISTPAGYVAGAAMSATGTILNDDITGTPTAWTPKNMAGIAEFIRPTDATSVTLAGSNVAQVVDQLGQQPMLQDADANRPQISSGLLAFTAASNNWLVKRAGFNHPNVGVQGTPVRMPDATPAVATKGFTNTGLARAKNNRWWVGNHGRSAPGDSTSTFNASVVLLANDRSTQVGQIFLSALGLAQGSVQGVVELPDGTIWIAVSQVASYLAHIQPTYDGSNNLTGGTVLGTPLTWAEPNGLAYDIARDKLIVVGQGNNLAASWISPIDASVSFTRTLPGTGIDHLFYNGDDDLWYTTDVAPVLRRYNVALSAVVELYTLPDATSIEGVVIEGNVATVCSDEYFHQTGTTLENTSRSYQANTKKRVAPGASAFCIFLVAQVTSPGSTKAIVSAGQPISSTVPGYALFSTSATNIRCTVNNTVANFTVFNTNVLASYIAVVNWAANTVELFRNGTSIGVQTFTGTRSSEIVPYAPLTLNGYLNASSFITGLTSQIGDPGVATGLPSGSETTGDLARLAGFLAWEYPDTLVPALNAANPYKNAAPTV